MCLRGTQTARPDAAPGVPAALVSYFSSAVDECDFEETLNTFKPALSCIAGLAPDTSLVPIRLGAIRALDHCQSGDVPLPFVDEVFSPAKRWAGLSRVRFF